MPVQIPAATRGYSDYILYPNLTETAVQDATPTESYGNFGLTSGSSGRPGDAEDAQLQGQRRVVADQRGQLDQGPLAEHRHRGVVLLVVQVGALRARAGQRPHHRVGDLLLLVGEAGIRTGPQRLDLRAGEPGVP